MRSLLLWSPYWTVPLLPVIGVETPDAEGHTGDIRWNFEKFLISPAGEVVGRFNPTVAPDNADLRAAIDAQLAG